MLGLWKKNKPLELRPATYALIDGFHGSTEGFYRGIEEELAARNLPGLEVTRIGLREGNRLSARRDYLRLRRERLSFDVCSVPFGTSWFFSYRLCEIPAPFFHFDKIIVLGTAALLVFGYISLFGVLWGGIIIGMTLLGLMLVLRNALTLGLSDFDAWLLAVPIFGRVYEEWFRGDSFFRQDTRMMWAELMDRLLQQKMKEVTAAQGIEHVDFIESHPDAHPMLARMMRLPAPTMPRR